MNTQNENKQSLTIFMECVGLGEIQRKEEEKKQFLSIIKTQLSLVEHTSDPIQKVPIIMDIFNNIIKYVDVIKENNFKDLVFVIRKKAIELEKDKIYIKSEHIKVLHLSIQLLNETFNLCSAKCNNGNMCTNTRKINNLCKIHHNKHQRRHLMSKKRKNDILQHLCPDTTGLVLSYLPKLDIDII